MWYRLTCSRDSLVARRARAAVILALVDLGVGIPQLDGDVPFQLILETHSLKIKHSGREILCAVRSIQLYYSFGNQKQPHLNSTRNTHQWVPVTSISHEGDWAVAWVPSTDVLMPVSDNIHNHTTRFAGQNLTLTCTPEMAFTTVDFPCATWPIVPAPEKQERSVR